MDSLGQVLAYVYTETGNIVDENLVRDGLAWALTNDGQHQDVLVAAERNTQQEGVGCLVHWVSDAVGDLDPQGHQQQSQ
jgi:endonuclease YncB( thermonuclease family)